MAVAVAIVTAVVGAPVATAAEDPGQRVTELNRKAVEAYENLEIEEAGKYLRQALEVCAAEGLNNRAKARTHIHMGIVLVGGFKQRDRGIQQYKRALEIDPNIGLTKTLVNPEIQSAFDEARKEMAAAVASGLVAPPAAPSAQAKPPEAPPPAASEPERPAAHPVAGGIQHTPLTEARPSSTISVKATVDPSLAQDKVILAYRPEGASDFLARDMEKNGQGSYVARIPEPATRGSVVSYYIEARNRGGQPLAASGSATDPYVISLSREPAASATTEAEPPVAVVRSRRDAEEVEPGVGEHRYFLSIGLGSGFGWAKGTPEVNPTDKRGRKIELPGGFAPARLMHIAPELGFFVAPNLMLSLQGRLQVVTSATEVHDSSCPDNRDPATNIGVCPPARWAVAVLGKATWLLGEPRRLRPFVSVAAGGGEIRHLVKIANLNDCGADGRTACQDTLLGGVLLIGPAAGIRYDLAKAFSAVVSLNSLVGLPNPTVNFDLNLGLAIGL